MTPPVYLSHSQVETLTDCGEKYRLGRVVGVPETPAMWNVGGRAYHSAIEYWERERFEREEPSIDQAVEEFSRVFETELSEAEADYVKGAWPDANGEIVAHPVPWRIAARGVEDEAWWREHGAGMVRAYVLQSEDDQTELAPTPDGRAAVEVEFMVTIAGVPFKGYIDQVRKFPNKSALIVRDLKAGKRTPTSTTQLGEYGVSLEALWGIPYDTMRGEYFMARTARTTPRLQLAVSHPRVTVEYGVATAWFMKNGGLFLPRPSSFCKSCAFSAFCIYQGGERAHEVPAPMPPRIG
jgi:hypothetical protein